MSLSATGSFAKNAKNGERPNLTPIATNTHNVTLPYNVNVANKTTSIHYDTIPLLNNSQANLLTNAVAYNAGVDSGVYTGVNALGYSGFAERYHVGAIGAGYTVNLLGVLSLWAGVVNPNSTNSMACTIWTVDSSEVVDPTYPTWKITALPGTQLGSQNLALTAITPGSLTTTMFSTPVSITNDFYAGFIPSYSFNQSNGDTLGLFTTPMDSSYINGGIYVNSSNDTVQIGANVVKQNGSWIDMNWDLFYNSDFSIIPLVQFIDSNYTSVQSITKNNLTIFSNYPNPAVNNTNIKFSLIKSADATIQILDMQGRVLNTITKNNMSAGEHTVNVSTANLASGNYIYYISTSDGSKLASTMTVAK